MRGQVVDGPYVAVGTGLDPADISRLLEETGAGLDTRPEALLALGVSRAEPAVIDCVARRIDLISKPLDRQVLEPLLRRELLWHLLKGAHGGMLRHMAHEAGPLRQIQKVILYLRQAFADPHPIAHLADMAGMSETSFYRHFKAVTAMSPLQFQKQLRLQAARNILVTRGHDVAGVGSEVGYSSPSQFSREYSRYFGEPPCVIWL